MATAEHKPKSQPAHAPHDAGCPILMQGARRCSRQIYDGPIIDGAVVCLMHSRDPGKAKYNDAFQAEFERILAEAGDKGVADFSRFVFPSSDYSRRQFKPHTIFFGATFTQSANFTQATFTQGAVFEWATFTQAADFRGATFSEAAYFDMATFTQHANFGAAAFAQDAHFGGATFTQSADFTLAAFTQAADFRETTFSQGAVFRKATFTQAAYFIRATFTQAAVFSEAVFQKEAYFAGAAFLKIADFSFATFKGIAGFNNSRFRKNAVFTDATFEESANFSFAIFEEHSDFRGSHRPSGFRKDVIFHGASLNGVADFEKTNFRGAVDFTHAIFQGPVHFRETKFRGDPQLPGKPDEEPCHQAISLPPGPIFGFARFAVHEAVTFYKTYIGQALFHNCDVSRFLFSDVRWPKRKGNKKRMVFDEQVTLGTSPTRDLKPEEGEPNERNYRLIAELYQQLKKNYDDRRDYLTAGDFHYGEMEMKRLESPRRNRFLRWLHRNMGLVAWYKYVSEYGENYVRPVPWLGIVLAVFTFAYPLAGLRLSEAARESAAAVGAIHESPLQEPSTTQPTSTRGVSEVSYGQFPQFVNEQRQGRARGALAFFGHSLVTALYVAAFQKDLVYEPSYPWGRVLALVEVVLTSTLIALFLLAVRRQFRR